MNGFKIFITISTICIMMVTVLSNLMTVKKVESIAKAFNSKKISATYERCVPTETIEPDVFFSDID